jgi:hypothetical protein
VRRRLFCNSKPYLSREQASAIDADASLDFRDPTTGLLSFLTFVFDLRGTVVMSVGGGPEEGVVFSVH